jgi:Fe-S-cluster-containing dehydrogenase component
MSGSISRRKFLKGSLTAACSVAVSQVPAKTLAASSRRRPLATLLDLSKCVGCGACVEACCDANHHKYPQPEKPYPKMYPPRVKVEDWSERQDEDSRLTPYNWLFIQNVEVEVDGEITEVNIPRRCMHCVNPPCVKLCPWGAARQLPNGIAQIESDLCMGGAKCRAVCPWHIPQRQTGVGLYLDLIPGLAGNGVMYKCDRCHDRVARGKLPACIEACPEGVQTIGPRDEIVRRAHALAGEMGGHIYGETENGGTNTLYVSPVPFDLLNQAVETGAGKPYLARAEDRMADTSNLTRALLIAPFAGIAAALGRFYKMTRTDKNQGDA